MLALLKKGDPRCSMPTCVEKAEYRIEEVERQEEGAEYRRWQACREHLSYVLLLTMGEGARSVDLLESVVN
jgi:hypothetical protein